MAMRPLTPPFRGVANNSTFTDNKPGFAPLDCLLNAVVFTPGEDRPQMGQRDGLVMLSPKIMGDGKPVQAMCGLTRSSNVIGSELGLCEDIDDGTAIDSPAIAGNLWVLDEIPSLEWLRDEDVTDDGGAASTSVNAVAAHPTNNWVAYATNYTVSGLARARVVVYDLDSKLVRWKATISEAGVGHSVNTLCWGLHHLFVAENEKIRLYDAQTGEAYALNGANACNGWSNEVIEIGVHYEGGSEYLTAAFNGSQASGTYNTNGLSALVVGGGTISAGIPAMHFRSGVMRFFVYGPLGLYPNTLEQQSFGQQLDISDTFFETTNGADYKHGYFRISEQTGLHADVNLRAPHGCLITAMRVSSTGEVFLTRTNQGWGPNNDLGDTLGGFTPNAKYWPNITVMAIEANGTRRWEVDTDSAIEVGEGGYLNDLLAGGDATPDPSLLAIAVSLDRQWVYVAGRKCMGYSVRKLDAATGSTREANNLTTEGPPQKSARQAAITVDPSDGTILVAGDRTDQWSVSPGSADYENPNTLNAHLWRLDPEDLRIINGWDLAAAVSGLCVAVTVQGRVVYGTDQV